MSGGEARGAGRKPRIIAGPRIPAGPLRELKALLYQMYVEAQTPSADSIAASVAADDTLPGAPSADTVHRILGDARIPSKQADAVSVAVVLARSAEWDADDAANRVRELWVRARMAENSPGRGDGAVGLLRPVAELDDPFALEVHRSIEVDGLQPDGLDALPTYVRRRHDRLLAGVVAAAVGGRSSIAVLVGGSSTGKTRACWEALRAPGALPAGWRLWHPIGPGRPEALSAGLAEIPPDTVLWLNETQHYLLTPGSNLGEQAAAGLRELLRDPARGPVIVLGTLWPEYAATLTAQPAPGGPDAHVEARALLAGSEIPVPETFAGAALQAVRAASERDPRLALAVKQAEDGQITQFLAGAPELARVYDTAPPAAKALIHAAMDARRLGHGPTLPSALLEAAVPGYLTDWQWDQLPEDWLDAALAYCARPCRGARGPLTRIRPRPGQSAGPLPGYRLADYLEQIGRAQRATIGAPASLWQALDEHALEEDRVVLGGAAFSRGLYRLALRFYTAAGRADALEMAGSVLREAGRIDEALGLYERAVQLGNGWACHRAEDMLRAVGRGTEVLGWLTACAEAGMTVVLADLAWQLHDAGRTDEALEYFARAIDAGFAYRYILEATAKDLGARGRVDEALAYFKRAARKRKDDSDVLRYAVRMLRDADRGEEVFTWLTACVETEIPAALRELARELRKVGRTDEALSYYERADEEGVPDVLREAGRMLHNVGRTDEALACFARAAQAGDVEALAVAYELNGFERQRERLLTWLNTCIDLGIRGAVRQTAGVLRDAGRIDEAMSYYERAAREGDLTSLIAAADMLRKVGRTEEALSVLEPAVHAGNLEALQEATRILREAGEADEAVSWLERAARAGNIDALRHAAGILRDAGRIDEALGFFERAAASFPSVVGDVTRMLCDAGRGEEALDWLIARSDARTPGALGGLGMELRNAGRIDEALSCFVRAADPVGLFAGV